MPDLDNPLASDVAEQFMADRAGVDKIAKEWTEKYGKDSKSLSILYPNFILKDDRNPEMVNGHIADAPCTK
jgi:hypothetical protein